MNALTRSLTLDGMTVALTPKPLEVRTVTTSHTKKGRFYTVFVGHGSDGEYYEVNEHVLGRLRAGRTPDDLCLEPFDPDTFNAED